jgi:hypothetical protein
MFLGYLAHPLSRPQRAVPLGHLPILWRVVSGGGMTNKKSKGIGKGSYKSTVPVEILEILQNNDGVSRQDIRKLMHYKYCPRTICTHLSKLRVAKKVECYINGNMRRPLYRVVKP